MVALECDAKLLIFETLKPIFLMAKVAIATYIILTVLILNPSTIAGQAAPVEITARSGDGIQKLLREHGLDPAAYTDEFVKINRGNIGRNNTLYEGRKYLIPGAGQLSGNSSPVNRTIAGTVRDYAIFGKKYSRVEITDKTLDGAVYYLMSGHGGPDPGASEKYGNTILTEDEYAYDVTLRLARNLIQHGALVYMITRDDNDGIRDQAILARDSDEKCYPSSNIPANQNARLRQRTTVVNGLYTKYRGSYQRLIVIHVDSRSTGENIDVFFYHHGNSSSGKRLADNIQVTFREKYRKFQPGRNYYGSVSARNGLWVVRNTHPPVVFIELGNIRNPRDQLRFVIYDNRQAMANWIAEGIIRDFKSR